MGRRCLAASEDQRVTAFGRTLANIILDELPRSSWEILKGDMSIVGPRPRTPGLYNKYGEDPRTINGYFNLKPGITSLGMVKFGYAKHDERK